jgi:hypothetical protein
MTCPFLHRTGRLPYPIRLYLCKSPAIAPEICLPTLGELRRFCQSAEGHKWCPAYAGSASGGAPRILGPERDVPSFPSP